MHFSYKAKLPDSAILLNLLIKLLIPHEAGTIKFIQTHKNREPPALRFDVRETRGERYCALNAAKMEINNSISSKRGELSMEAKLMLE